MGTLPQPFASFPTTAMMSRPPAISGTINRENRWLNRLLERRRSR